MKVYLDNKKVGNNLVIVRRKVKKNINGLTDGKIIECRYPKGKITSFKISTKAVDTRKTKGCMVVKFNLIKNDSKI